MSETAQAVAYWLNAQGRAPDVWKIDLARRTRGRVAIISGGSCEELIDEIRTNPHPAILTIQSPVQEVAGSLDRGSAVAEALDSWQKSTESVLELERSMPDGSVIVDEQALRERPAEIFSMLGVPLSEGEMSANGQFPTLNVQNTLNARVASVALAIEPWRDTCRRLRQACAAPWQEVGDVETLARLEALRNLGTNRLDSLSENEQLRRENLLLLNHLHEAEDTLLSAVRDRQELKTELRNLKSASSPREDAANLSRSRELELEKAVEHERARVVRFKAKIQQLRKLLQEEREARSS